MVTLRDILLSDEAPLPRAGARKPRSGWRDEVHQWLLGPPDETELENKAEREEPGADDFRPERVLSRAIDILKGALCMLMVASHVNLCLVHPKLLLFEGVGHTIGNLASSLCLLGFVFAYGWSCWDSFVAKTDQDLWTRVARSSLLPVGGAVLCSLAWCFVAFKIPLTARAVWQIVTFYHIWGNGPDFLLTFTICLLLMMPFRSQLRNTFGIDARASRKRVVATVFIMLGGPILMTFMVVPDCSGPSLRRYLQYLVVCDKRDALGMASFPVLPHCLYFNAGLVLAAITAKLFPQKQLPIDMADTPRVSDPVERAVGAARQATAQAAQRESEGVYRRDFLRMHIMWVFGCFAALVMFALPVLSVWKYSYGNLAAETPWGHVVRGFSRGPSALWLLGNMLGVFSAFLVAVFVAWIVEKLRGPAIWLSNALEHFGANVLLYLIVTDVVLAGLYHGDFPLTVGDGGVVTMCLLVTTRLVHYLCASTCR